MTTRSTTVRHRALIVGTSLLVLTTACAKKDATADTAAATGSTSVGTSTTNSASTMTQSQKAEVHDDLRSYRLTEDDVNKVIAATQKMRALQKSNPQLAATMNQEHGDANDAKSIDEAAARLDAVPPVKGILSDVGISSHDYLLTTFALMEAGAAYQFQKAGKLPPNSQLAKDVSPENMAYIGTHQAQLQALEKANGNGEGE